jgi:hypothetical protein
VCSTGLKDMGKKRVVVGVFRDEGAWPTSLSCE